MLTIFAKICKNKNGITLFSINMLKQKNYGRYVSPTLTLVPVKVERGYAVSMIDKMSLEMVEDEDSQPMEEYTTQTDWGSNGSFWD